MSGTTKIVFDTCAIVNLLDEQYDLLSLGIKIDEAELFTSVIVRMELLAKRNITDDEERDIREFLNALTVVSLNDAIEKKAVELRRSTKLKLPDCIVAANLFLVRLNSRTI